MYVNPDVEIEIRGSLSGYFQIARERAVVRTDLR
jgi:hypothetical protein